MDSRFARRLCHRLRDRWNRPTDQGCKQRGGDRILGHGTSAKPHAQSRNIIVGRENCGNSETWSQRDLCRDKLSQSKLPKHLLIVDQLPRNAMGKVTKRAVCDLFAG